VSQDVVLPPPVEGKLRDGTPVRYVAITPADRERLREAFQEASAESIYRRFLTPVHSLNDAQLDYLTNVDFVDHVAYGVETVPDGRGIAIGRWIRLRGEPESAEVAVAVLDDFQRRGIATELLRLLAGSARARGVKVLRAEVLADNEPVRRLLEKIGQVEIVALGSVLQVSARL
jgi:ribosomal protein S18 acetylase RimI-like enzyme